MLIYCICLFLQSYGNAYPTQGYPGAPSPTQPTSPEAYGTQMGPQAPGTGLMPNMSVS